VEDTFVNFIIYSIHPASYVEGAECHWLIGFSIIDPLM